MDLSVFPMTFVASKKHQGYHASMKYTFTEQPEPELNEWELPPTYPEIVERFWSYFILLKRPVWGYNWRKEDIAFILKEANRQDIRLDDPAEVDWALQPDEVVWDLLNARL
jgi:hypothetical protein